MSYQILAHKYRPGTFDEVLGQESVTRTLKNSVDLGRVANAYIFCGPRGVGKTSVARILSKTLNCEKPGKKGPCGKCVSCLEIAKSNSIDVLEIDGASNRGIDEIRTLRENVKFSPSSGKYKIYIIDEVHMLTQEAFNALLKTLEEPPAHVKFIFATTEPQKVLPTIMSRCQRFDFKRIPPSVVYERLMDIAAKEDIRIDEKAALIIARSADGSLRDALVVLDQMVAFSGEEISPGDVEELLGMVDKDRMAGLVDSIIDSRSAEAIRTLDELISGGKDPVFITNSLISYYRDLMILVTSGEPTSDMAFTADELSKLREQAAKLSLDDTLYILQNLTGCLGLMKGTLFARAPLEITVMRLANRARALSLGELMERIESVPRGMPSASADVAVKYRRDNPSSPPAAPDEGPLDETPLSEDGESPEDIPGGRGNFGNMSSSWRALLNYVRDRKMSVYTFLNTGKPLELGDNKVVIGFSKANAFNKEALESNGNRAVVEEAAGKVLGARARVEFALLEFLGEEEKDKELTKEKKARSREAMKPVIERAIDVFGGHVVRDLSEEEL